MVVKLKIMQAWMRCEHLCTYCISSKFREDFKGMFVFKKLGSLDQKGPSLSFFQLMLAPPKHALGVWMSTKTEPVIQSGSQSGAVPH